MNTVQCAHLISPVGEGVSGAWKIMGDDGTYYLVKLRAKGDQTVLNEMLCGILAVRFGLPSFEPVTVTVGAGPLAQINAAREEAGLAPAEPGAHFGVRFMESFLTVESLDSIGATPTAGMIDNLGDVPDILGFDTMVQNIDRHCGNTAVEPNEFGTGYSYRVFDFGHAFGGPEWTAGMLEEMYRNLAPIERFCPIADRIAVPGDFEHFLQAFESHLGEWLDEIVAELPPGLGHDAGAAVEAVRSVLVALEKGVLAGAILGAPALQGR